MIEPEQMKSAVDEKERQFGLRRVAQQKGLPARRRHGNHNVAESDAARPPFAGVGQTEGDHVGRPVNVPIPPVETPNDGVVHKPDARLGIGYPLAVENDAHDAARQAFQLPAANGARPRGFPNLDDVSHRLTGTARPVRSLAQRVLKPRLDAPPRTAGLSSESRRPFFT